jgi:hypothetical protein
MSHKTEQTRESNSYKKQGITRGQWPLQVKTSLINSKYWAGLNEEECPWEKCIHFQ